MDGKKNLFAVFGDGSKVAIPEGVTPRAGLFPGLEGQWYTASDHSLKLAEDYAAKRGHTFLGKSPRSDSPQAAPDFQVAAAGQVPQQSQPAHPTPAEEPKWELVHVDLPGYTKQNQLTHDPKAFTPASPGTSLHEAGRAFDVNYSSYVRPKNDQTGQLEIDASDLFKRIVHNAKKSGLYWGGDFCNPDPVHFYEEVPGGREHRAEYIRISQKAAKN